MLALGTCWPQAMLAPGHVGPGPCWPRAMLALGHVRPGPCWPQAMLAISKDELEKVISSKPAVVALDRIGVDVIGQ